MMRSVLPGAGLQQAEVRQAVCIKRDHLPVDDELLLRLGSQVCCDAREPCRDIDTGPRPERHGAPLNEGENAVAVQLRLEEPLGVGEGPVGQPREHRLDFRREGRLSAERAQTAGQRRRPAGPERRIRELSGLQVLHRQPGLDGAVLFEHVPARVGVLVPVA